MHDYARIMHKYVQQKTASVIGARGYTGLETARLLLRHPHFKLTHAFATGDFSLASLLNSNAAKEVTCLKDSDLFNHLTDVVFLATPAEVSLQLAPQIIAAGKQVIDLSGAFRLKKSDYSKWYGFTHTEQQALASAHYGLVPWASPAQPGQIIANPGCYATAINLALIPLLKWDLIAHDNLVIDAKSGATGAGKKASENLLFTEVEGECLPYKVGRHQHYPEIQEAVSMYSEKAIEAHLTTSLLPLRRGIIAGIYAHLKTGKTLKDVKSALNQAYAEYPLLSFGDLEMGPGLVSLKKVVGTARTHISFTAEGSRLYVFSCIDNLMKGAASQAIENANRLFDFPVAAGLTEWEGLT